MMGYAKVAKKIFPDCQIHENEDAGMMDVRDSSGNLLVAVRKLGHGGVMCAQARTGAKYPLAVLQSEHNLWLLERLDEAKKAKDEAAMAKYDLSVGRTEADMKRLRDEHQAKLDAAKAAAAAAEAEAEAQSPSQ